MVNDVVDPQPSLIGHNRPARRAAQQSSIWEHNLELVLRTALRSPEPLSRSQIAQRTGMTRATATLLGDQLVAARILRELPPDSSAKAGRPGIPLTAARNSVVGLGLEINVDYIGARALDLSGATVAEKVMTMDVRGQSGPDSLQKLAELVSRMRADVEAQDGVIIGATLGLPGLVDSQAGPLRLAPNLGWRDFDALGVITGLPAFAGFETHLANEANLAAVAEASVREEQNFIYVSGEIGVGGGLVIDGEVFSGKHGWSGELGHVTVEPDGPVCECGARGCLQRLIGQEELFHLAQTDPAAGVTGLLTALDAGETPAERAMEKAGRALGLALSDVINLVDVNNIVIGGFHAPLLPWIKPVMEAEMAERVLTHAWSRPNVLPPKIVDGASLTGAALTALRGLTERPAAWLEKLTARAVTVRS